MRRTRTRRFAYALGAICLVALTVRVGYVVGFKRHQPALGDQIYYRAEANLLARGHGFADPNAYAHGCPGPTGLIAPGPVRSCVRPSAEHPPLTALVLAPVGWFVDPGPLLRGGTFPRRLEMSVLGVGVVALIGLVGREVAGERTGLIAAGLAAVAPTLWINDGLLMSETSAALVIAALVLVAFRYARAPSVRAAALLGALVGAAALVRAELILALPFVVFPVVMARRVGDGRRRVGHAVTATLVTAAVALVWVGPNLVRFTRPVLFSTNDGLTLCGANSPHSYYGSGTGLWSLDCAFLHVGAGDASVRSDEFRHVAVDYARDHASRVPVVVAARVLRTWGLWDPVGTARYSRGEGRELWASWAATVFWWLLLPVAAAGTWVLGRRRRAGTTNIVPLAPLLGPAVLVTVTSILIYGLARFRVPFDVTAIVLGAVALDAGLRRLSGRRAPAGP